MLVIPLRIHLRIADDWASVVEGLDVPWHYDGDAVQLILNCKVSERPVPHERQLSRSCLITLVSHLSAYRHCEESALSSRRIDPSS